MHTFHLRGSDMLHQELDELLYFLFPSFFFQIVGVKVCTVGALMFLLSPLPLIKNVPCWIGEKPFLNPLAVPGVTLPGKVTMEENQDWWHLALGYKKKKISSNSRSQQTLEWCRPTVVHWGYSFCSSECLEILLPRLISFHRSLLCAIKAKKLRWCY